MSEPKFYRVSWETADDAAIRLYSDVDPVLYKHTIQVVPNGAIPEEHWHPVSRETSNPWQQYDNLKSWADADEGFVRNVRLERMVSSLTWVEVPR